MCIRDRVFAAPFEGVPDPVVDIWADDPMVCFVRLKIRSSEKSLGLPLSVEDGRGAQKLALKDGFLYSVVGDKELLRFHFKIKPLGKEGEIPFSLKENPSGISLVLNLEGRNGAIVDFFVPYITFESEAELRALKNLNFEKSLKEVVSYWRKREEGTCLITTPEPMINEFYRSYLTHVLINTEREVGVTDRYMAKVGTFYYGVYSNESCMMISELDRRGLFDLARKALETFLYYQGTVALPGDFSSKRGIFYGAGGYEAGGYNQHHGWVLWALAEHYFFTRDKEWLRHAAPHIIDAFRWVASERLRTKRIAEVCPIRRIERGLLPQGRLEDIGDWRSWLSTNVYTWWGMKRAVEALLEIGHPEALQWKKETEDFGKAILQAFMEAARRSPVVKLRDGSFVPHVPSEVHRSCLLYTSPSPRD